MKKNHSLVSLYIIFLILVSCKSIKNKDSTIDFNCEVVVKSGTFLYEFSPSITILDDMILRDPSIVHSLNGKPDYDKGLFIFGDSWFFDKEEFNNCPNKEELINKIKPFIKKTRTDILNFLNDTKNFEKYIYNKNVYKRVNITFEAVNIGIHSINFINEKGIDIYKKEIPIFLILNFKGKQTK